MENPQNITATLISTNKAWYKSKTLWVNAIAIAAMFIPAHTGIVLDAETQVGILGFINLILRLVTKDPLNWSTPQDNSIAHIGGPGSGEAGFINLRCLAELFLIGALIAALAGCATMSGGNSSTPLQTAGKSLLAAKSAIVTAATAADSLCKSRVMPADKCSQAKQAYELSKPAYDTTVDAYLLMSAQGGDSGDFSRALLRLQDIAANLLLITGGAK